MRELGLVAGGHRRAEPPAAARRAPKRRLARGRLIAFDLDEPKDLVEGEHARRQAENNRGVSTHDSIEISTIMQADLHD
jgi:hypothetical protein